MMILSPKIVRIFIKIIQALLGLYLTITISYTGHYWIVFVVLFLIPLYGIYLVKKTFHTHKILLPQYELLDFTICCTCAFIFLFLSLLFLTEWFRFKTFKEIFAQAFISSALSFLSYLLNLLLLFRKDKVAVIKDSDDKIIEHLELKQNNTFNIENKVTNSENRYGSNPLFTSSYIGKPCLASYHDNTSNTYRDFIDPYSSIPIDRSSTNTLSTGFDFRHHSHTRSLYQSPYDYSNTVLYDMPVFNKRTTNSQKSSYKNSPVIYSSQEIIAKNVSPSKEHRQIVTPTNIIIMPTTGSTTIMMH